MTPTSAQLRQTADAIDAHARGEEVEYSNRYYPDKWMKCFHPNWNSNFIYRTAPKPVWSLSRHLPGFRPLTDSEQWHREDFTQDMLPEGWRPLLLNEKRNDDDEVNAFLQGVFEIDETPSTETAMSHLNHLRTRRLLPPLAVPWSRPEHVALGAILERNSIVCGIIMQATRDGVYFGAHYYVSYKSFDGTEQYRYPGGEWKPCTV